MPVSEDLNPAEDEAYGSLFRPEPAAPVAAPEPVSTPEPVSEPVVLSESGLPLAPTREPADTGRLFRTNRATTETTAIIALRTDQAAKLHTLQVIDNGPATESEAPAQLPGLVPPTGRHVAPAIITITPDAKLPDTPSERTAQRTFRTSTTPTKERGLRPIGVYVVVIGATLLFAIIDIFVGGPGLGLLTGLALLISSGYAALTVRTADLATAVIAPPIAFFLAAITIGQIGVTSTGGIILGRAVAVFFTLADNWLWVIGSTLLAFAIVVVRTRRR